MNESFLEWNIPPKFQNKNSEETNLFSWVIMILFQVYVFVQGDTLGVQWLGEDLVLFWRVSIRSFSPKGIHVC